ncbi:MAG: hypothetical protein OXN17_17095 [Candidatus Poribacteria bacterium]|nr:hypothetical protein [Candidatus Poribacteria bacterium]
MRGRSVNGRDSEIAPTVGNRDLEIAPTDAAGSRDREVDSIETEFSRLNLVSGEGCLNRGLNGLSGFRGLEAGY